MTDWISAARARWPAIALDDAAFLRHLNGLGRTAPAFPSDSYLAAACAAGDAAALRAIDEEIISRVPNVLRRVDASPAFAAEVCQELRIRLFVSASAAPPRIARYTGEVPLSAWIRVIALRLALNAKRAAGVDLRDDTPDAQSAALDDPELEYLRSQYREPFARCFRAALAALPKDDRTILRLHYVDGLNIEGIGKIFQAHRATVARWLVRIRTDVLANARTLLAEDVGADLDEAGSVIGALAGELDVTLSRALITSAP